MQHNAYIPYNLSFAWLIAAIATLGIARGQAWAQQTVDSERSSAAADILRLVGQLDSTQLIERNRAEQELLQAGPNVLASLPRPGTLASSEARYRLRRVIKRLQRELVDSASRPSVVEVESSDSWAELAGHITSQTGNRTLVRSADTQPREIRIQKLTFWDSIAEVIERADVQIDYAQSTRDRVVLSGFRGAAPPPPESFTSSGPLRLEWKSASTDADGRVTQINLRVLWEPRLNVVKMHVPLDSFQLINEQGIAAYQFNPNAKLNILPTRDQCFVEFAVPTRPVLALAKPQRFTGKLHLFVAGPEVTLLFEDALNVKQPAVRSFADMTVALEAPRRQGDAHTFAIAIEYELATPDTAIESHFPWIEWHAATLVNPNGEQIAATERQQVFQDAAEYRIEFVFRVPPGGDAPWDLRLNLPGGLRRVEAPFVIQMR